MALNNTKMHRFFCQIIISLSLIGCHPKNDTPFFEYDEIIHYSTDFDGFNLQELVAQPIKSATDSLKLSVLTGFIPKDNDDLFFIDRLDEIGYTKKPVAKSRFAEINNIFSEKKADEIISTSCISIYRDILIFKKQNKVAGTAKICFECMDSRITGALANSAYFGQNGDYIKLQKILYE